MSLTVAIDKQDVFGNKRVHDCTIAFDSSYPYGGESLSARDLGLSGVDLVLFEQGHGHTFEYDHTNNKVRVYRWVPPIIWEETVTLTAGVGTLKYPYAFIISVTTNTSVGLRVIHEGLTPVTTTVAVTNPEKGVCPTLTTLVADGYTSLIVTYITQAWQDVFENVVHAKLLEEAGTATVMARKSGHASLSFTVGTPDVIKLGEVALAIQSITCVTELGVATAYDPCYAGVTSATIEAEVDFTDSGATSLTTVSIVTTDNVNAAGHAIYIDYIRRPASGFLFDRWIEEDDCTPSSDIITISTGVGFCQSLLLFGTCQQLPSATAKTARLVATIGGGGAVSTDILLVQPTLWPTIGSTANTFTFGSTHDDAVHAKLTYVWGWPWEIPGIVPLEVRDATNLASLTDIKCMVIGF